MTEGRVTLREGDCRDVMLDLILEGVQVDAIVTDPPYHLSTVKRFGKAGAAPARSNGPSGVYKRAAAGFIGKAWDGGDIAFDPETWALCLKLLKPGGHLLAFSGTRTYHRMACAIEDAGFEIRDQIGWAYGSGFPKSHDVSKAIDKVGGVAPDYRDIAEHIRAVRKASGVSAAEMASWFPYKSVTRNWERTDQGQRIPSAQDYAVLVDRIGASPQMEARRAQAEREVVGRSRNGIAGGSGFHAGEAGVYGFRAEYDLTVPATEAARQWEGWGTALKPAWEPIVVARKPLSEKSVATNVLEHGTGALNIDGCRVPVAEGEAMGRWPANLIHDGSDEVLALFPDSNGSGSARALRRGTRDDSGWGMQDEPGRLRDAGTGSAARFFFQAQRSDEEWLAQNLRLNPANIAEKNSFRPDGPVVSALKAAVCAALPGEPLCEVLFPELSTSVTPSELRRLCESAIETILSFDAKLWLERRPISVTAERCPVSVAVQRMPTGTTTITVSHWKSDGSVDPVTFNITSKSTDLGDLASARFKYHPKASKADRAGSRHPTVKPIDLMRYLCRLVTPPGGTVLDPFAGSGTTGQAAVEEGFRAVLIEREAEYIADIRRRLGLPTSDTFADGIFA